MRSLIPTVVVLSAFFRSAQAVILASNLPACAKQCPVLTGAENTCAPPFVPVSSDQIYEPCLCQFPVLSILDSLVLRICISCSADMMIFQEWYNNFCPSAGKGASKFGKMATASAVRNSTAMAISVTSSTRTHSATPASTQTVSTIASSGPSSSPIATSSRLPTAAKIGIGVGVPVGMIFFISMILLAYRVGQRKQLTGLRRELHSSSIHGREVWPGGNNDKGYGVRYVPEIHLVEKPVDSGELEGSFGRWRSELP